MARRWKWNLRDLGPAPPARSGDGRNGRAAMRGMAYLTVKVTVELTVSSMESCAETVIG